MVAPSKLLLIINAPLRLASSKSMPLITASSTPTPRRSIASHSVLSPDVRQPRSRTIQLTSPRVVMTTSIRRLTQLDVRVVSSPQLCLSLRRRLTVVRLTCRPRRSLFVRCLLLFVTHAAPLHRLLDYKCLRVERSQVRLDVAGTGLWKSRILQACDGGKRGDGGVVAWPVLLPVEPLGVGSMIVIAVTLTTAIVPTITIVP
jgi:hypothetical protein